MIIKLQPQTQKGQLKREFLGRILGTPGKKGKEQILRVELEQMRTAMEEG